MQTIFSIPGIHCEGCGKLITDVTQDSAGVQNVVVDVIKKTVTINHDATFDRESWKNEIQAANPDYTVHSVSSS